MNNNLCCAYSSKVLFLYLNSKLLIISSLFFLHFAGYKPKYSPPPPPPQVYQQCKEVAQETCYNIPQIIEKEIEARQKGEITKRIIHILMIFLQMQTIFHCRYFSDGTEIVMIALLFQTKILIFSLVPQTKRMNTFELCFFPEEKKKMLSAKFELFR